MNDAYSEWLVKRKTPAYMYALMVLMSIITVVSVLVSGAIGIIGFVVMVVAGGATYFLHLNLNIEYEYLFSDGELTIDKIMGKSKRKKAWEGKMEDIRFIASSDSATLNDHRVSGSKKLDFSSQVSGNKTYTIIYQSAGEHFEIVIEPNDKMLQCFRQTAPRKIVI